MAEKTKRIEELQKFAQANAGKGRSSPAAHALAMAQIATNSVAKDGPKSSPVENIRFGILIIATNQLTKVSANLLHEFHKTVDIREKIALASAIAELNLAQLKVAAEIPKSKISQLTDAEIAAAEAAYKARARMLPASVVVVNTGNASQNDRHLSTTNGSGYPDFLKVGGSPGAVH
jgi:hypothetical protein